MSVERKLQRFKGEAVRALTGMLVQTPNLNYADAETLVEELGPLVRPLFEELDEAVEGLSNLRGKLTAAERRVEIEHMRDRSFHIEQSLSMLRLKTRVAEQEAAELRAKLVLAELDEELRKAGFESPLGIAGLKDAMGFLERYRDHMRAFEDFISRIADIEGRENEDGPGEPIDLKDAMERLDQIRDVIKEFDDYDR